MIKRILISIFFTGFTLLTHGQNPTETVIDTVYVQPSGEEVDYYEGEEKFEVKDTVLVLSAINMDLDSLRSLKDRKEFAYSKNLDSLLKASQEKQPKVKQPVNSGDSFMTRLLGGPGIKIILWMLALAFLGIIIYQLLKNQGVFQRSSASKLAEKTQEEELLLLHDDFKRLAQQALERNDYRMAVRYHFLDILQQLRDKNHINYEPDKTNGRYMYELPVNWRNDFAKLSFQYEYVWYGHFEINQEQYEQVNKAYQSFLQKI